MAAAPKKDDLKAQVRSGRRRRQADEEEARQRDAAQALFVLQAGDRRRRQRRAAGRLRLRRRREARRVVQAQGDEQGRGDDQLHQAGRQAQSRLIAWWARQKPCRMHRVRLKPDLQTTKSPPMPGGLFVAMRSYFAFPLPPLDAARAVFFAALARSCLRAYPCGRWTRLRSVARASRRLDELVHRFGQRIDALGEPLDVALRVDAELRQRARNAILEHLLQLVPRSADTAVSLPSLSPWPRRARPPRCLARAPLGPGFQRLALLHQRFEHASCLRPARARRRRAPQARSARRVEHGLRQCPSLAFRCAFFLAGQFGPGFLEHRAFSSVRAAVAARLSPRIDSRRPR